MEIHAIKKPIASSTCKFIDNLLGKRMTNEPIFDDTYFLVYIKITDNENDYIYYMYRLLWEKLYIHQKQKSLIVDDDIVLVLSISDAIGFINFATPPLLKHLIPEAITSLYRIHDILKQFLLEGNGDRVKEQEYIGYFRQFTKLMEFDTTWTHDDSGIELIRDKGIVDKSNPICVLDAYNCSFGDIYSGTIKFTPDDDIIIQATFDCCGADQLAFMGRIILQLDDVDIVNLKHDNNRMYVTIVYKTNKSDDNASSTECVKHLPIDLHRIIQYTYNALMDK